RMPARSVWVRSPSDALPHCGIFSVRPAHPWQAPSAGIVYLCLHTGGLMDSTQLQPWQARRIRDALRPALGYLSRLQRRMELTGFPPGDPLYLATVRAQRAMQDLLVELHYLSCQSGVGRARGE